MIRHVPASVQSLGKEPDGAAPHLGLDVLVHDHWPRLAVGQAAMRDQPAALVTFAIAGIARDP
jgi:hypothetical protein